MSKLYPCIYYTEDGHCEKYSDDEVTSWCVLGPCEYETPSNADRIRRMSDEELAEFLWDEWMYRIICDKMDTKESMLKWLMKEVEDG